MKVPTESVNSKNLNLATPAGAGRLSKTHWLDLTGLVLLLTGFSGPWLYGPLGKTGQWGWQPVWGCVLSAIPLIVLINISFLSCFSYVEWRYRRGEKPVVAIVRWVVSFLGLFILLPLVIWSLFDLSQRSALPALSDGALGWGMLLTLGGQLLLVVSQRLKSRRVKSSPPNL